MFARDEEGRIGLVAGFGVSVTRPVVLGISLHYCPPGLGLGPIPTPQLGEAYRNRMQTGFRAEKRKVGSKKQ